jgi:hypothetical protein
MEKGRFYGNNRVLWDWGRITGSAIEKVFDIKPDLPPCPAKNDLLPVIRMIRDDRASFLIYPIIRAYLKDKDQSPGRGFSDHLVPVSLTAAYAAWQECEMRGINGQVEKSIIRSALWLGAFHDIERGLGYGDIHAEEGVRTTARLLKESSLNDVPRYLLKHIFVHDRVEMDPGKKGDPEYEIPLAAVFAADHIHLLLDWISNYKKLEEGRPVPPQIDNTYKYLIAVKESSILKMTEFGRNTVYFYLDAAVRLGDCVLQLLRSRNLIPTIAIQSQTKALL